MFLLFLLPVFVITFLPVIVFFFRLFFAISVAWFCYYLPVGLAVLVLRLSFPILIHTSICFSSSPAPVYFFNLRLFSVLVCHFLISSVVPLYFLPNSHFRFFPCRFSFFKLRLFSRHISSLFPFLVTYFHLTCPLLSLLPSPLRRTSPHAVVRLSSRKLIR